MVKCQPSDGMLTTVMDFDRHMLRLMIGIWLVMVGIGYIVMEGSKNSQTSICWVPAGTWGMQVTGQFVTVDIRPTTGERKQAKIWLHFSGGMSLKPPSSQKRLIGNLQTEIQLYLMAKVVVSNVDFPPLAIYWSQVRCQRTSIETKPTWRARCWSLNLEIVLWCSQDHFARVYVPDKNLW